jgi:hypothetical protein
MTEKEKCIVCLVESEIKEGMCKLCAQDIIKATTGKDTSFAVSAIMGLYKKGFEARLGEKEFYASSIPATLQIVEKHMINLFSDLDEMNRVRDQVPCPLCGQMADLPVTVEGAQRLISANLQKTIEADAALVKAHKAGKPAPKL